MTRSLALLALIGAAAAAQTTTVSVFLPMFDEQALVASVIAADADKTTYLIGCPHGTDSSDCGVAPGGQTIVYGPKTFALDYAYKGDDQGDYKEHIDCNLQPAKDSLTCSVSVSQSYDGTQSESSTVMATSGYLELLFPVTVTAGAEKLNAASTAASTLSTVAAPASTTGAADATATATNTDTSKDSSAAATPSSTASGNAAGAKATQNAVLAGAAVLVGGAAMLL
ncbi:hypothetical protein BGZ63DRAFT_186898 [Mariannaea sp. PMI_226]|nr:hypothetical protein BGZ63DRAFT_186898 [Mariannaea sp. PMI_226]